MPILRGLFEIVRYKHIVSDALDFDWSQLTLVLRAGTQDTEEDWEQDETMIQTKHHGQWEHFEEWDEDVRGGESKQDQSQERGEASIEDCWAYGVQWGDCSTDTCSWNIEQ